MRIRFVGILLGFAPFAAQAQNAPLWRTVDIARQLRDTMPQRVKLHYTAGRVDVRGTSDPLLYSMHLRYDESRSVPLHRVDAEQHSVALGVESRDGGTRGSSERSADGELRVGLSRTVPIDLELDFGGTHSTLDLGEMSLQSLRLEYGAAEASLMFSRPNRVRMRDLEINVGAADFSGLYLANANADQIRVRGGVGSVDLDFSGAWTKDLSVTTRLTLGKLTLRVPSDVGVRLEVHRIAAGFERAGFIKRDDAWYSPNFETAKYKLRMRAETYFGKIEVQHPSR